MSASWLAATFNSARFLTPSNGTGQPEIRWAVSELRSACPLYRLRCARDSSGIAVDVGRAADLYAQAIIVSAITVSAITVSATTGGCATIGAPHREHTRAVAATLAAHSRHLIWVMMAYGLNGRVVLAGSLRASRPPTRPCGRSFFRCWPQCFSSWHCCGPSARLDQDRELDPRRVAAHPRNGRRRSMTSRTRTGQSQRRRRR